MIFHTAAEINYYNVFFKRWHNSIRELCPEAKFSLKYVGDVSQSDVAEYAEANNIDLIIDPITEDELVDRYGSIEIARGYYPMARWNSIPDTDHVCVTDVDVVMIKNDVTNIIEQLEEYDFVSISRMKANNKVNPMMVNYINQNSCASIRDYAMALMDDDNFCWDIDLRVMKYMKENLNYVYHHRLERIDHGLNLRPNITRNINFVYYSAMPIEINNVSYPGGLESKKIKYEWADSNNAFNTAIMQSANFND